MSNPGPAHWKALKHLIRYLRGTQDHGLTFDMGNTTDHALVGYSDSSFGDCVDTGRSTLAYTFLFHGAALSWYSKLNSFVTLSTNHAEYAALSLAGREAEWLVQLLRDLDPETPCTPVPILVDNSGVVSLVYNPVEHQSNKHVKLSCHYSRELTEQKIIFPRRIASEDNLADLFTKSLPVPTFKKLASHLVQPCLSQSERVCVMMVTHSSDTDSDSSLPGADWEVPAGPERTTEFQAKWPYISTMKRYLNASSCEVRETGEKFSSGRTKLCAMFFYFDDATGTKHLISTHDAMSLTSKNGNSYTVCSVVPHSPDPAPAPEPSIVHLAQQTPLLTCSGCHTLNHLAKSFIVCANCHGREFNWCCACYTTAASATANAPTRVILTETKQPSSSSSSSSSASAVPANNLLLQPSRPKRNTSVQKKWTAQIKYEPPIMRSMLYHHVDCEAPEGQTTQASKEFANAYSMKPAPCCKELWQS